MNDVSNTSELKKNNTSTVTDKLFDAAIFLGFVSGVAYLVGYAYFWSFLTRLSLRPQFVEVATMEYMWQAFVALFFVALLTYPAAFVAKKAPNTFMSAAIGNMPIFALSGVIAWSAIDQIHDKSSWVLLGGAVYIAIQILYLSFKKKSFSHYIYSSPPLVWVACIGFFSFLTLLVASQLGTTHAQKLVEGSLHATTSIKLSDKNGKDLLGPETWILVLIDQSNYVVVKRSDPVPKCPLVKLINKADVNIATIQRLN